MMMAREKKYCPAMLTMHYLANYKYDRINYHDAGIGVSLPLNFSSGKFIRKANLGTNALYTTLDGLTKKDARQKIYS